MTDFLYATQGVVDGVARTLDLGGVYDAYNQSATPDEADARAIRSDWVAVAKDIRQAMTAVDAEVVCKG